HHAALRAEAAARQFVGRDDAVDFFHAFHHFEDAHVEIGLAADAAEHGVERAGGAMDIETVVDEAVDHPLDLFGRRVFLHDDYHGELCPTALEPGPAVCL